MKLYERTQVHKVFFYVKTATPIVFVFFLFLSVWHLSVSIWEIPPYVMPSPARVYLAAKENMMFLTKGALLTGIAAFIGFISSIVVGIGVALLFSQSKIVRHSFYPYAIFLQTVPIIAIAPLIVIWFGNGLQSVVIVAFIMGLFPIITNFTAGLITVKQSLLDLFIINDASRLQILFKLRFPHAIPHLIVGAKISSGLCVIGAIVGEFFAGYSTTHYGLGYIITVSSGQLKTDYLFAAVFMSTLLSLFFFSFASLIGECLLKKWKE